LGIAISLTGGAQLSAFYLFGYTIVGSAGITNNVILALVGVKLETMLLSLL